MAIHKEPQPQQAPPVNQADYNNQHRLERLKQTGIGGEWEKWGDTRRFLAKTALVAGTSAAIVVGYYSRDVAATQHMLKDSHPVIRVTGEPLDPADSHRMTLGINGLGTTSARNSMEALPYESIGLETALEYDKKGIDTTDIKNTLKDYALERGIDQIVLSGHSMGGLVALEVASLLHVDPQAPEVSDIILDSTPPNLSAVHEDKRRAGDAMLAAVGDVPGHRDSQYIRLGGELISRYNNYTNEGNIKHPMSYIDVSDFIDEVMIVRDTKLLPKAGTLGLVTDQYRQIAADGAHESYERLSKDMPDKRTVRISVLRPFHSEADQVVLNDKASDIHLKLGEEFGINVNVYRLPDGTNHANPAQRPEEYSFTVNKYILPTIRESYEDYAE